MRASKETKKPITIARDLTADREHRREPQSHGDLTHIHRQ